MSNKTSITHNQYNSVAAEPPTGGQENEKENEKEGSEDEEEEETDEESEEEEEEDDDDEMEHSGTESDKAVSTQPDIIATAAAVTGEPGISSSPPPPATALEDHVITEDTPTDAVDTPSVATNQSTEPSKLLSMLYINFCTMSLFRSSINCICVYFS